MKVDAKPYKVRTKWDWKAKVGLHRWRIEFWDGDDHSFRPFTFRWRAVRWAARQDETTGDRLDSGGAVDAFIVVGEGLTSYSRTDGSQGCIRYIQNPIWNDPNGVRRVDCFEASDELEG